MGGSPLLRALVLSGALLLACSPFGLAAQERPALPDWLVTRLAAEGLPADASDVRVERTTLMGDERLVAEVPLDSLPERDPVAPPPQGAAPPQGDSVLLGQLTQHTMLQVGACPGYGARVVAHGIALVQDASWAAGVHVALGPAAGGVAASTSGDPGANAIAIVGEDRGMTMGAGQLSIREDRVVIFGSCFVLLGQMSGTGAWEFN